MCFFTLLSASAFSFVTNYAAEHDLRLKNTVVSIKNGVIMATQIRINAILPRWWGCQGDYNAKLHTFATRHFLRAVHIEK